MSSSWHRSHFGAVLACIAFVVLAVAPAAQGADRIYWANDEGDSIGWTNLDGTGGAILGTAGATKAAPNGMAIDSAAGRVYWANYNSPENRDVEGSGNTISWANLDGSGGGDFLQGGEVSGPHGVAIDPTTRRLYWVNYAGTEAGEIHYTSLDGGPVFQLNTSGATTIGPRGLAVDPAAGRLYWANFDGNRISYANLNGSGGGDVNTTGARVDRPEGVAIDPVAGRIYWSNFTDPAGISYANLNGTGGGDLNTDGATLFYTHGVAIDPETRRIYWANFYDHVPPPPYQGISYASLNGSGGDDLGTTSGTLDGPALPVLLKAPVGTGVPQVSGGTQVGSTLSCSQGSWAADMVSSQLFRAPRSNGFTYHWSRNGADLPGAASSTYTAGSDGQYRCTVTARNEAGTAGQTSAPHTIQASQPPPPPSLSLKCRLWLKTRTAQLLKAHHPVLYKLTYRLFCGNNRRQRH